MTIAGCAGGCNPRHVLLLYQISWFDIAQGDHPSARSELTRHNLSTVRLEDPHLKQIRIGQGLQYRCATHPDRRVGPGQPVIVVKARAVGEDPFHRLVEEEHRIDVRPKITVLCGKCPRLDLERSIERDLPQAPRQGQEL